MQNKIIIIVVALIIIIAGFLGYTKLAGKTSNNPSITITNEQDKKENTLTGTIKDLLAKNLTQKCTIVYPENKGTGTIYFAGKKFNGEFTMNIENQKMTSYTISDGTYMYIWTNNSPTGMKMKISEQEVKTPTGTTTQKTNLEDQVKFTCTGWTLNQTKFTPPANIKFESLDNLFPTAMPTKTGEKKAGESICDQISDQEAKTACLDAIKNAGE
jgi:hypothetical protein